MKLPKKIYPDRIKDAIVEFRIESAKPFEVVLGLILDKVIESQSYKFINSSNNIPLEIQEISGRKFLFYNDNIKFHLTAKTITVNCFSTYISWDSYREELKKVIILIHGVVSDIKIKRIGLRYVSEYIDMNLKDCLKFNFTFGYPDIASNQFSFNSEFPYKKGLIILTLRNSMPAIIDNKNVKLSHIDIDVIKKGLDVSFVYNSELINLLEEVHSYEKEVFFNLLNDSFLNSLQPTY